ncbi:hypothetical protein D3C76_1398810 [compost metagenome]
MVHDIGFGNHIYLAVIHRPDAIPHFLGNILHQIGILGDLIIQRKQQAVLRPGFHACISAAPVIDQIRQLA